MKIKKIFQNSFKTVAIFIFKLIYGKVKVNNVFFKPYRMIGITMNLAKELTLKHDKV